MQDEQLDSGWCKQNQRKWGQGNGTMAVILSTQPLRHDIDILWRSISLSSVILKNALSSPFFCWCHYYLAVSRFHQTSSLVSAGGSTFSRDALLSKLRCSFLLTEQTVTHRGEHRRTKGINSQHFPRQQHAGGHHRRQVLMEPTNDCHSPTSSSDWVPPKATSLKMPQKIRFT